VVNKTRLYWSLQFSGWAAYAGFQTLVAILATDDGHIAGGRVVFFVAEAALCLLITHLFRSASNRFHWLDVGLRKLIPVVLATVVAMGAVMYVARIPVSWVTGLYNAEVIFNTANFFQGVFTYGIFFFIWAALYFIYNYFERYNKSLKLEASFKEIELNNLKSQINPHFIFNALNSIRGLVDENPVKAKLAINQMSNILRNSLVAEKRGLSKFSDELRIVTDYLGLESIRFEERLRTEFDIDPASHDFYVPTLMVQTLVENGIKHGISQLRDGGLIQIRTRVEGDRLRMIIRNSGSFKLGSPNTPGTGLGLDNTRQRLKLIYHNEASFRIITEKDNFVVTEVTVPHLYNV